jgi:hypothetical protein
MILANQKVRSIIQEFEYWNIKEHSRIIETNTLESWEKSRIFTLFVAKNLYARMLAKIRRKQGLGKKLLLHKPPLFIVAREGGSFKKSPRFDHCEFSGGRVSNSTFRGWRFFTRIQKFSWKRIIGINPLPRGASVGEFGKNLTPSKRRVWRNSWNKFADHYQNDNFSFVKTKRSRRDYDGFLSVFQVFK